METTTTYNREYYLKNKDKFLKRSYDYIEKNIDKVKAKRKEYYYSHIDLIKETRETYKDKRREYAKKYYEKHKDKLKEKRGPVKRIKCELSKSEYHKQWRLKNADKIKKYNEKNRTTLVREKPQYPLIDELIYNLRLCKGKGELNSFMKSFFDKLVHHFSLKFYDKTIIMDQQQTAYLKLYEKWSCYNELKTTNPLSYFTEIVKRAMAHEHNVQHNLYNSCNKKFKRDFNFVSLNELYL